MRTERCEISDGTGLFDIRGTAENILYYNQKPYAYEWSDNMGSMGKYLARSNSKVEVNKYLNDIRYYAEHGMHDDVKMAIAIDPLLKLLSNGIYELIYPFDSTDNAGLDLVEFDKLELVNLYPTPLTLICLQPLKSLDISRIEYFKEKILNGVRPVIFVLGLYEAGDKYILDGHHKAYAYNALGVDPNILFIRKEADLVRLSDDKKVKALNHIIPDRTAAKGKHPLTS